MIEMDAQVIVWGPQDRFPHAVDVVREIDGMYHSVCAHCGMKFVSQRKTYFPKDDQHRTLICPAPKVKR